MPWTSADFLSYWHCVLGFTTSPNYPKDSGYLHIPVRVALGIPNLGAAHVFGASQCVKARGEPFRMPWTHEEITRLCSGCSHFKSSRFSLRQIWHPGKTNKSTMFRLMLELDVCPPAVFLRIASASFRMVCLTSKCTSPRNTPCFLT